MWFKKALSLMELNIWIHPLPAVVIVMPIEVRVKIPDPVQGRARRADPSR